MIYILANFLATTGISHFTTPPYTCSSKRRHHYIIETWLSLLSHTFIPLKFWPQSFSTTVYLTNRLPTPILSLSSPSETIFGAQPNFSKLKIFGCLCYPWLHPYSSHKLDACSKSCVSLGYSTQSAYLWFDLSTSKPYASKHAKFIESIYPFHTLFTTSPHPQTDIISTWIPPPILVPLISLSLSSNDTLSNAQSST